MKYTLQIQADSIAESVRARFAMISPILTGMLYSTKQDLIDQAGGYDKISFEMFCRIYVEHPGDYGICFEYAVHRSIFERDATVYPLVSQVIEDFCKIKGGVESILFGAEKKGAVSIIETAKNILTDQSRILVGKQARPAHLKRHLDKIAKAFRSKAHEEALPRTIRGVWKADLFLGSPDPDQWVATTLKTNRRDIEQAAGLRVAMYPEERRDQGPKREDNLIYCPLPYSGDFMELFGASFQIVKQVVAARGKLPGRATLVYDDDMTVAKWLTDRGHYPLLEVLEALEPIKQPGLMEAQDLESSDDIDVIATAPIPLVAS